MSSSGLRGAESYRSCSSWGQGTKDPGRSVIHPGDAEQTHQEVLWRLENESLPCQVKTVVWHWSSVFEALSHPLPPTVPTELCSWNPPCWCWMNPPTTWTWTLSSGSTSTKPLWCETFLCHVHGIVHFKTDGFTPNQSITVGHIDDLNVSYESVKVVFMFQKLPQP